MYVDRRASIQSRDALVCLEQVLFCLMCDFCLLVRATKRLPVVFILLLPASLLWVDPSLRTIEGHFSASGSQVVPEFVHFFLGAGKLRFESGDLAFFGVDLFRILSELAEHAV